jgi:hypothetical protein
MEWEFLQILLGLHEKKCAGIVRFRRISFILGGRYWICLIMTRRLFARPAAVALVSIGKSGP